MANWVTFAGVIVRVDAPESTPEHEVAAKAREQLLEMLGSDSKIKAHDVGVTDIGLYQWEADE